jgi:hypothetical protein
MARSVDKLPPTVLVWSSGNTHTPAANTAAVVTKAAVAGKYHVIRKIFCGYTATPTGGYLQIEDVAANVVFKIPIPAAGMVEIDFGSEGIRSAAVNTALIVTLAAGSGAVVGSVNVTGYSTQERA